MSRPLTETQHELLRLAALDCCDKEIASTLEMTYAGTRWHWKQIFEKLGCRTRAGAVARGLPISFFAPRRNAG